MHTLPTLPYAYDALEPVLDRETMEIHHLKHHQTYIDKLNEALTEEPEFQNRDLVDLMMNLNQVREEALKLKIKNQGGGHLNHTLFWEILRRPQVDNEPDGLIKDAIDKTFGDFEQFKVKFSDSALAQFGSGWAWLNVRDGQLEISRTANQDSPLIVGVQPILGLDVWEHAYYLTYRNRRAEYVKNFWAIVNWAVVEAKYNKIINKPVLRPIPAAKRTRY